MSTSSKSPEAYETMDRTPNGLAGPASLAGGERGDDASDTEAEEEQSDLTGLLQQVSLTELREIARQRGWRVRGASKADYVPALASLLCDPTETARAVTGMPENLHEALRAAFVADDGSGITATTMAQTMTALRGAAGAAIKPVEAAALLSDLARWGFVLQWRDSLYGEGRHILPWQVQRLVPPLPGWCPLSPNLPVELTRSRNARQAVNSLCAVWKSIAAGQPAVRPPVSPQGDRGPAERMTERRLSSMVQGWPYDAQELRDWASNRRRADTAAQTFSVPPIPLLVEDAVLATLVRLTESDDSSLVGWHEEQIEFLCRMLCELGLVTIQSGHLIAQHEEMARFLQLSAPDQHRTMAQAYLSLLDWSELDLLLRRDTHLSLWRKPYFGIPYDQFRSLLVRLRHLLLRFLACTGEDGWCKLSDVETALRKLWPHFAAPLQGERQSWLSQAWGLYWRQEGCEPATANPMLPQHDPGLHAPRSSDGDDQSGEAKQSGAGQPVGEVELGPSQRDRGPADWSTAQGAFLRGMLEGPLYWLGFAELSYRDGQSLAVGDGQSLAAGDGQLAAFRLHGLANWIWDRPAARFDFEGSRPTGDAITINEAAGTISVQTGFVPPQTHTFLGRIARLEEASPDRFLYQLHPQTVLATFESGTSLSDLIAEWEGIMSQPIPTALREMLSQFWARYGQIRLYEGFCLLELNDEVTLRELEASTSLSQHIVARLSPRLVLVPDDMVEALMREFAAKAYTPKEVE